MDSSSKSPGLPMDVDVTENADGVVKVAKKGRPEGRSSWKRAREELGRMDALTKFTPTSNIGMDTRRKKIRTLDQAGMGIEEIVAAMNAPREDGRLPTSEEMVTVKVVVGDLMKIEREYADKTAAFDQVVDIGRTISKYDYLYEQTVQQMAECPEGSNQRKGYIDQARQVLEGRNKFLQQVGMVDKVAEKKLVDHTVSIMSQISAEQKRALEQSLISVHMQNTQKRYALPAPIVDVEAEELHPVGQE